MTFTEAAAQVLRLVGKPLHYKEITDVAIERNLLSHVGKSPEVTMGARLAALVKKGDKENPLVRIKPGVFALREWDEATIEKGLADRTPALQLAAERSTQEAEKQATEDAETEDVVENGARPPSPRSVASHKELGEVAEPTDDEERHRAALSAAATELFEQEEDDDQPIFGVPEEEVDAEVDGDGDSKRDGRRRRRRRRGRGKREDELGEVEDDLPSYTLSDAPADLGDLGVEAEEDDEQAPAAAEPSQRPARAERDRDRDRSERDRGERDRGERDRGERDRGEREADLEGTPAELGRSLADNVARALSGFDRSRGPVSLQNVADAVRRKLRGNGELSLTAGAVAAAVAADNLRAEREGRVPRFRIGGGRVALAEWSRDRRAEAQQRVVETQVAKLREMTRRALLDALRGLSQKGLGELLVVVLEQAGVQDIAPVRRPGTHGAELHLQGVVRGATGAIPVAILIRRDGKDIGRERVTELRGALHHYGPATQGWLITTGQVLSGAREEAAVPGAAPVTLTDGLELARLCEQFGVGVITTRIEVPVVDVSLFDTLQG
ncbi:MAG: hypothetical protein GX607_04220 [Myxococcales bacterium]|jgi:hypothetical protein|nr:hypothetical protein [Myxococcales bacterium]